MKPQKEGRNRLREIEEQVIAEGREWMRQRLQQKLQEEAERDGEIFPPQPTKAKTSAPGNDALRHRRRKG